MKARIYAVLVVILVSTACAGGRDVAQLQESEYNANAYQFSSTNCTTGQKEFPSNDEMCWVIQSESQNRFCAESQRAEYFRANCTGTFTPRA